MIDGYSVKLQIWDSCGQERFNGITDAYYRGSHGILLVYDVSDSNSMGRISFWNEECKIKAPELHQRILIGNKIDLRQNGRYQCVTTDKGQQMADQLRIEHFIETSAKSGQNVDSAFECLAEQMMLSVHRVQRPWSG